jgi:hypothetical protein
LALGTLPPDVVVPELVGGVVVDGVELTGVELPAVEPPLLLEEPQPAAAPQTTASRASRAKWKKRPW